MAIKLNDKIKVTDSGRNFSCYSEWAEKHGMDAQSHNYSNSFTLFNGDEAKVIAIGPHGTTPDKYPVMYGIMTEEGHQYIIDSTGVELVSAAYEFDITADISCQFTRDGRKILSIHDTGHDIKYPLAVMIEGDTILSSYTRSGQYYIGPEKDDNDLITRTEQKPLIVKFRETYIYGIGAMGAGFFDTLSELRNSQIHQEIITLSVDEIKYDPNTNTTTTKEIKNV